MSDERGPGRPVTTGRKTADAKRLHVRLSAREWEYLVENLGEENLATKVLDLALVAATPGALTPQFLALWQAGKRIK